MKTPTEVLRDEHRVILGALDMLETAAQRVDRGGALPESWWAQAIEWLRGFADRNHHAKEERSLFPAMVKAGVPSEGGPIGVMLEEHTQGRALIQAMADAGPAERPEIARRYVRLLRDHIEKENGVLFPLADAVLDGATQATLGGEFQGVSDELGREASVEWARATLDQLGTTLAG